MVSGLVGRARAQPARRAWRGGQDGGPRFAAASQALSGSEYRAAEAYFDVYAVIALDGQAVVTAAHRTRRRRLH